MNQKTDAPQISRYGLMRHSRTTWNLDKKLQGQTDSPLTDQGIIWAEGWGRKLAKIKWDRIVCSDLNRAVRTAELMNAILNLPITSEPLLRELDWGLWTGYTVAEVEKRMNSDGFTGNSSGWGFKPPGGESRHELLTRNMTAMQKMYARWPEETILVVAHGGVIKGLIYHLLNREYLPSEPPIISPYTLHWLSMEDKELRLDQMNAITLNRD